MKNDGSTLDPEGVITKRRRHPIPKQTTAVSAVTGGSPEDMNEMPPDTDVDDDRTVYDGSDLKDPDKNAS